MATTTPSTLGRLLKHYRSAAGFTQEELAERAGMSARGLSDIERGISRTPYRSTVRRLAEALELPAEDRARLLATVPQEPNDAGPPETLRAYGSGRASTPNESAAPTGGTPTTPTARTRAQTTGDQPLVGDRHAPAHPHNDLPAELTPLVGRERAQAEAVHLLRGGSARLLTLTGTGGVGKTRLAVRVAATLAPDHADGVVFVPLAPITDPGLVAAAVAARLDVPDTGTCSAADAVIGHLYDKDLLLVLDNFEQVVEAAPLVSDILASCPAVRVLVTSRERLHITGEQEAAVEPLEFPDSHAAPSLTGVLRYPAVALFVQRARAVDPHFAVAERDAGVVVEICARLDGVPLALELAAARTKHLPLASLLAGLREGDSGGSLRLLAGGPRDSPARQRTMHATIAWSYDLLTLMEQRLFRRLAVFSGGFTPDAVARSAVWPDEQPIDVLEGLTSLVDKSLIVPMEGDQEARFRMLAVIREFGRERLSDCGEADEMGRMHAQWVRGLVERAAPELVGSSAGAWHAHLERELDNIRAALAWARDNHVETGLRIAAILWRFWWVRAHGTEGRARVEEFLTLATDADLPVAVRADGFHAAAALACYQGDNQRAQAGWEECLALRRWVGDEEGIAEVLNGLGCVATELSDYDRAAALLEECAALREKQGHAYGLASATNNLANVSRYHGDYGRAAELYERSIDLYRSEGDLAATALSQYNLAQVYDEQGRYGAALQLTENSLALHQEAGDRHGAMNAIGLLGNIAVNRGDLTTALGSLEECLDFFRSAGDINGMATSLMNLGWIALHSGDMHRAEELARQSLDLRRQAGDTRSLVLTLFLLAEVLRRGMRLSEAEDLLIEARDLSVGMVYRLGEAQSNEGLARVAIDRGEWRVAARLYDESSAIRAILGTPVPHIERTSYEANLARVRRALADDVADGYGAEGEPSIDAPAAGVKR